MKSTILFKYSVSLFLQFLVLNILFAQQITLPISPVSFPKEVMPVNAGKIDFYAKLTGFSGTIPVGGVAPHFFLINDGTFGYHMGFNANDGAGNGGLTGGVGNSYRSGTGLFGSYTYEQILGVGQVEEWHHYVFQWNKDGIPGVDNGQQKLAIFIDGILNSNRWSTISPGTFGPFSSCPSFDLIGLGNQGNVNGQLAIDEFKIFDSNNNLVLWNTLGSQSEIEHSNVGLNGSFNGSGNAQFVPGISGNATMAVPIFFFGSAPNNCPTCTPPNIQIEYLGNLNICQTRSVLLSANGNSGSGYTYQWMRDNLPIPGAISRRYSAKIAGSYTVLVKNNLGCSILSNPTIVTTCVTTKEQQTRPSLTDKSSLASMTAKLNVTPNPVAQILNIVTEGFPLNRISTIYVLSSLGTTVKIIQSNALNKNVQLDVSSLRPGTYIIKIVNGENVMYKQFIKL